MGTVHSQIKSRSLPPPPSPAAAAALHHSSGTSDQIPSSSIVRGETLPARSEASSLSAPPPRVLRDGDRGLPCHRPRRGGLLWQGLQGQAQVHSPGQTTTLPSLDFMLWILILCLYNWLTIPFVFFCFEFRSRRLPWSSFLSMARPTRIYTTLGRRLR